MSLACNINKFIEKKLLLNLEFDSNNDWCEISVQLFQHHKLLQSEAEEPEGEKVSEARERSYQRSFHYLAAPNLM